MSATTTKQKQAGAQYTPGPLAIINSAAGKPAPIGKEMAIIVDSTGHTVADCQTTTSKPLLECRANAREIVRRYNTFPLLLEACKNALAVRERAELRMTLLQLQLSAAIAAATATEGEGKENL